MEEMAPFDFGLLKYVGGIPFPLATLRGGRKEGGEKEGGPVDRRPTGRASKAASLLHAHTELRDGGRKEGDRTGEGSSAAVSSRP